MYVRLWRTLVDASAPLSSSAGTHTQRDGNSKGDDERREKKRKTPKCLPSPHLDTTGQPAVDDESPLKNLRREALAYMCVFYIQKKKKNLHH
jgi:hypothetical protein